MKKGRQDRIAETLTKHLHSAILSFIPRLFIFVKEVKDGSFCILHPLSP